MSGSVCLGPEVSETPRLLDKVDPGKCLPACMPTCTTHSRTGKDINAQP